MAYIKKYSEVEAKSPIQLPAFRLKGEIRAILRDENLNQVYDSGWAPNILTETGRRNLGEPALGTGSWFNYIHIGENGTAPTISDNSLLQWLGYSSVALTQTWQAGGAPDYWMSDVSGKRFNVGVATGTIREVGLSNSSNNQYMSIRTLLPAPIVKGADQALDVYHRFTMYPPTADVTGQVTIEGALYDYTIRPWYMDVGVGEPHNNFTLDGSANNHRAYGSTIVSALGAVSPSIFDNSVQGGYSSTITTIGTGFGYYDERIFWPLEKANGYTDGSWSSNGILATTHYINMRKNLGGTYGFQIGWSRVSDGFGLNKTPEKIINLDLRVAWARH